MSNSLPDLIEFPKISSFQTLCSNVRQLHKKDLILPTIEFTGYVKAHGSNCSIVFHQDGSFHTQSRSRVITPLNDNYGFATWAYANIDAIRSSLAIAPGQISHKNITVYGEWCGESVQHGVAISSLPKMWIVFAIKYQIKSAKAFWFFDPSKEILDPDIGLYSTGMFQSYPLTIDFNKPQLVRNQIVELTETVEAQCPIGTYFGVKGIGEGLVFSCMLGQDSPEIYTWKSKGEKHSQSKVKTVGVVDVEAITKQEDLAQHLLYANQLEPRPAQAIRVLKEKGFAMDSNLDIKVYLDWICADIAAENMQDLVNSGLKVAGVMSRVKHQAKTYYQNYLNTLV